MEITKGWWDSFRPRHPEISLRHAEPLSYARAAANNPNVIENYFELLAETIETDGLTRRPGQIFNCDETGMPLVHKPPKVVYIACQPEISDHRIGLRQCQWLYHPSHGCF